MTEWMYGKQREMYHFYGSFICKTQLNVYFTSKEYFSQKKIGHDL